MYGTPRDLYVLHTLRCIGVSGLPRVADATGLTDADAESELIDLAVDGLVVRTTGEFGGWGLTDEGRAADAERIGAELDGAGAREALSDAFDRFLILNPELLDVCTAWQTRTVGGSMLANDHSDAAYDARVFDRLTELHARAVRILADLTDELSRFERYAMRLAHALDRVNGGELDYVADDFASYHSIWFQLHEDLLVTLGIPRH